MKLRKICMLALALSCLYATVCFANPWPEFITAGSQGGCWTTIDGQYKTYEIMDDTSYYKPIASHFLLEYGTLYHFDSNGHMTINSWAQDSTGEWYYFGSDGKALKNQWIGGTYYVDNTGRMCHGEYTPDGYYVGADGKWDGKPASADKIQSVSVQTSQQTQQIQSSQVQTQTITQQTTSNSTNQASANVNDAEYQQAIAAAQWLYDDFYGYGDYEILYLRAANINYTNKWRSSANTNGRYIIAKVSGKNKFGGTVTSYYGFQNGQRAKFLDEWMIHPENFTNVREFDVNEIQSHISQHQGYASNQW